MTLKPLKNNSETLDIFNNNSESFDVLNNNSEISSSLTGYIIFALLLFFSTVSWLTWSTSQVSLLERGQARCGSWRSRLITSFLCP